MQRHQSDSNLSATVNWPVLKQVVVGFEIAEADKVVLDYLDMLISQVPVEEVHFLHVIPPVQLYYESVEKQNLPEWTGLTEEVMEKMRRHIRDAIDTSVLKQMTIDIRVGDAFKELLKDAEKVHADLLIIGQSAVKTNHAVLAKKLARQAETNVLVIPDYSKPVLSRILVPVDFSDLSAMALKNASSLAARVGQDVEVHCLNVFDVPPVNWARIQKSEEEMVQVFTKDRAMALDDFIKEHLGDDHPEINRRLERQLDGGIGKHITDHAESNDFDLIMMGAKGHSPVASLLLGSVAEKVLSTSDGIPVLIVR